MPGVVVPFASVCHEPFRMLIEGMIVRKGNGVLHAYAVWIKPRMKFHATLMRRVDHEGERIVVGFGAFALLSGKVFGPRFVRGGIKCIGGRAHLHNDGV